MDVRRMIAARKRRSAAAQGALERPAAKPAADACPAELADKCIALGISTGGPPALTRLLAELRPPMPPIVIVQHMPPQFTGPLAARLELDLGACRCARPPTATCSQPNCVLIAPGGKHLEMRAPRRRVSK